MQWYADWPSCRLIPAHAGKTGAIGNSWLIVRAHPRSRGENEMITGTRGASAGSSPLTRGKLDALPVRETDERLIPAHAGKTTPGVGQGPGSPAHPRSRGENAGTSMEDMGAIGSSPLTRGKRLIHLSSGV